VNESDADLTTQDTETLLRLQHAHRDAYELFIITYAATLRRRRATSPFTVEKLQTMMSGPTTGDGRNPLPRNTQFELFVAAMLVLGSLEVKSGEPDLRLLYGRELIGVAVKRLVSLSEDQVDRNFRDAISQIERSGLRGVIAVNVDSRFTGAVSHLTDDERITAFEESFNSVGRIFEPYREPNPNVLGYLAFGYLSEWVSDAGNGNRPGLFTHTPFRWFSWPNTDSETELARAFSDAWQRRVESHLERISSRDAL
jgi:hypothetical protein